MNNYLIIYCHPCKKSFNHAELLLIEQYLRNNKVKYDLIDLYADEFDPVYSKQEFNVLESDPLVQNYQQKIENADNLIFIFPIWWNDLPAMLKGFIDKVMGSKRLVENAYNSDNLDFINSAYIYTTSSMSTWRVRHSSAVNKVFVKLTLKQLGIRRCHWHNLDKIDSRIQDSKEKYLMKFDNFMKLPKKKVIK
ncbi:NAD(P)H-dependent oxidoreductase [Companilactobacillus keshanensis]|uniref:NAD(P)H-dependent oxidoreductase n=1 Tax=Companilactobacillus keshanensis TaxID=2486003 RepID=A0ABW4BSX2_9LACO|nr:NAD(P)H-dependent oxidoreductase [Companilactobacillus keshanensis]